MLVLHTANRYEDLRARLLADLASEPPGDPFACRQIIVPSAAIRRDLQLAIARDRGVCAQVEFPFLAQWLWDCIGRLVEVPAVSPFAPQRLTWRLYRIFGDAPWVAAQPRLAHFLAQADDLMRLELAERVAQGFEQLLTYRPEWLEAWSQHRPADLPPTASRTDEAWQAALWRRMTQELGTAQEHPGQRFLQALAELGPQGAARAGLPTRVSLFALNTLPPLYLRQLQQLGTQLDIALYVLNPCAEFWFDLVDHKRLTRLQAAGRADFHETGNRLLAAWGRQTQSLLSLLYDQPEVVEGSAEFVESAPSLLGQIQNSILQLAELPRGVCPADEDRSVEIHVCHSLTRQLEVLHDRLLGLTETLPDLSADQILVAVPDLEAAAPLIDAVFGSRSGLPYTLTGRPATRSNRVAQAVLAVLDAAAARLTASEGLALLRDPLIARRFQLSENEVDSLHDALREAGLHWGLEATRYSWREALGRLLLGVSRPAGDAEPFQGNLPAGVLGGQSAQALGSLWKFLEALSQLSRRVARPHRAEGWQRIWMEVLEGFLHVEGPLLEEAREVRAALVQRAAEMQEGDAPGVVGERFPFAVARASLAAALDAAPRGGIPGGTVTFAALSSLRNLPYRVVCLLGLDDGIFPGQQRPPEFDLIGNDYRPGDRQRRIDERNLFLDLLLSARDILHLSYTGRSQKDDSPLPPSVLVAELYDVLEDALGPEAARQQVVMHPLQAFSRRCFDPGGTDRLRSFDTALCAALQNPRQPERAFFAQPLPAEMTAQDLSLEGLQQFFRHPARAMLQDRLGLQQARMQAELCDEEPLLADRDAAWALDKRLLAPALQPEGNAQRLLQQALAGVELPAGALGVLAATRQVERLEQFALALRPLLAEPPLPPQQTVLPLQWENQSVALSVAFDSLRSSGLLDYRLARLSALDYLSAWLAHLALCVWQPHGVLLQTRLCGLDDQGDLCTVTFARVDDAAERLGDWLAAWQFGQRQILPLPPKTAWASLENKNLDKVWWDDFQGYGERDAWWQLALRGRLSPEGWLAGEAATEALRAEMNDWAQRLFKPLQDHLAGGAA